MTAESTAIQSVVGWNFCPLCGEKLTTNEVQISEHKKNLSKECPQHGQLFIK